MMGEHASLSTGSVSSQPLPRRPTSLSAPCKLPHIHLSHVLLLLVFWCWPILVASELYQQWNIESLSLVPCCEIKASCFLIWRAVSSSTLIFFALLNICSAVCSLCYTESRSLQNQCFFFVCFFFCKCEPVLMSVRFSCNLTSQLSRGDVSS